MTKEEILAGINEIMVRGFEVDEELLAPEARLAEDLGLDSLDGVDLVVAIEKKFDFRIEESAARQMRTMGDIYAYCEKQVEV
jgi:acyl carrier protein